MRFSFAIITYNNEKYILETLESIKYQIENYGKDYSVDLFVSDDASSDRTVKLAKSWAQSNAALFNKVVFLVSEVNKGTVYNFQRAIHSIETKRFKTIAGDDLFSSNNLFSYYEHLDGNTVLDFMCVRLCEGQVYFCERDVRNHLFNKKKRPCEQRLKVFRRGSFSNTPSLIYERELYDKSVSEEINSQFIYVEDYPTWYQMLKNIPDLKYCFLDDEIVLYRVHKQSISHASTRNAVRVRFNDDKNRLQRLYYSDSHGFERIVLWLMCHSSDGIPRMLRPSCYIEKARRFRTCLYSLIHNSEYKKLTAIAEQAVNEEKEYYLRINNNAKCYYESYMNEN